MFKSSLESCFQRAENWRLSSSWDACALVLQYSLCGPISLRPGFLGRSPALHALKPVRLWVVRRDTAVTVRLAGGWFGFYSRVWQGRDTKLGLLQSSFLPGSYSPLEAMSEVENTLQNADSSQHDVRHESVYHRAWHSRNA